MLNKFDIDFVEEMRYIYLHSSHSQHQLHCHANFHI